MDEIKNQSENKKLEDHLNALNKMSIHMGEDMFIMGVSFIHDMLTDKEAKAIGERVKEHRTNYIFGSMTQGELAEKANIKQSVVSRIEKGDKKSISYNINKVGKALGVRLNSIVLGEVRQTKMDIEAVKLAGSVSTLEMYATVIRESLIDCSGDEYASEFEILNNELCLVINKIAAFSLKKKD